MRSPLHWLLALLLCLALPLKGLAAAGPLPCGPGHGEPASAVALVQDTDGTSAHAGHHGMGHDGDAAGADGSASVKLKCSSCAPCCAAALPAAEVALPQRSEPARVWVGLAPAGLDGLSLDRLDRPPRIHLA